MAHGQAVTKLLEIQKRRDLYNKQHIERMFDSIPQVTEALRAMLQLPEEDVQWLEIDVMDDIVMVGIAIRFPPDHIPMFVQIFAPDSINTNEVTSDVEVIKQLIRVGLPLDLVEHPVQDIVQFFHDLAPALATHDDDSDGIDDYTNELPTPAEPIFDSSELTPEQTQKLLLFQNLFDTSKH
jgi:t-SNARE complex subunit (syntaxin)